MNPPRITIGLAVALIITALLVIVVKPGGAHFTTVLGDAIYVLAAMFAAFAGVYAYRLLTFKTPQGRIVGLLTIGMLLNAIAGAILLFYEATLRSYSYPSLADIVWIAAYLPQLAALAHGCHRIRNLGHGARMFGFLVAWLLLAVAVTVSLLVPAFQSTSAGTLQKVFNVLYPVLDLSVVLLAGFLAMVLWGGAFTLSWGAIFMGMFLLVSGNLSFAYLSGKGLYLTGSPSDIFWIAGFAFIALGFVYLRHVLETPRGWR